MTKQQEEDAPPRLAALGRTLRRARTERRLSVERLAERAGLSGGLLSQLERGLGNPSLSTLQKLAAALDLPLGSLFEEPAGGPGGERPGGRQCVVVRADARRKLIVPGDRVVYELLTPDPNRRLEMIRSVAPAGYDTSDLPFQHEGEECVLVLRGRLEGHVGEASFVLETGDTVTYDATLPHWWRNVGDGESEMIAALTPPSF